MKIRKHIIQLGWCPFHINSPECHVHNDTAF